MKPNSRTDSVALGVAAVLTLTPAHAASTKASPVKTRAVKTDQKLTPPSRKKTAAPAPGTPASPGGDAELEQLRQKVRDQDAQIQRLTDRLDRLEREKGAAPAVPPPPTPSPAAPAASAPSDDEPPLPDVQLPGDPGAEPANPDEPPVPEPSLPGESSGTAPAAPAGDATPSEPPVPDVQVPPTTGIELPSPTGAGPSAPSRASFTPDISVIGNNIGRFVSVRGDRDRNRLQLAEFEVGLQQPVYPGIRFDAFLAGDAEEDFAVAAEEVYATFSNVGGLPVGGFLGKKRLDFGKINPIHPHARLFADQPAVLSNFLGPDGLAGNGASFNYTLPLKRLFANVELGMWKVDPLEEGADVELIPGAPAFYPAGLGVTNNFTNGRLWASKELGGGGELELGASGGFGKADNGDDIRLHGVDFTLRKFPGTFSRFMLQGEALWHRREDRVGGTGGHLRSGQYLLLSYRPNQYREYGLRLDNSQFPWPIGGRERSASLIWSNRLTEGTLVRLQVKHGERTSDVFLPAARNYNDVFLQFIWAAGSHTHPLQ